MSQATDSRRLNSKQKRLYIGAYLNPLKTSILNSELVNISDLSTNSKLTINGLLDFGYFFTPITGISVGLGYSNYSSQLSLDNYETHFQSTDSENESFEMRINGNSISEEQNISFFNIPICLSLRLQMSEKLGLFLNGGMEFKIPVVNNYTGSGNFTYDGYYPAYPVLLQNLPEYGFPSNLKTDVSGDLKVKSVILSIIASGGVSIAISSNVQLILFATVNKSISNITEYDTDLDFKLTSKASELKSLMEGSTETNVQALGLGIGIHYFFK